jgi:hypothetical protein
VITQPTLIAIQAIDSASLSAEFPNPNADQNESGLDNDIHSTSKDTSIFLKPHFVGFDQQFSPFALGHLKPNLE